MRSLPVAWEDHTTSTHSRVPIMYTLPQQATQNEAEAAVTLATRNGGGAARVTSAALHTNDRGGAGYSSVPARNGRAGEPLSSDEQGGSGTLRAKSSAGPPVQPSHRTSEMERAQKSPRRAFCAPFLAVVLRTVRQDRRRPVLLTGEMIFPVLFTAVAVLLWVIYGWDAFDEATSLRYSGDWIDPSIVDGSVVPHGLCYNTSVGTVPGVQPCTTSKGLFSCEADFSGTPLSPYALCAYEHHTLWSILDYYLHHVTHMTAVPPLDDVVLFHWLAQVNRKRLEGYAVSVSYGKQKSARASSMLCSGTLYFVGEEPFTAGLVEYINSTSQLFSYVYGGTHPTVESARAAMGSSPAQKTWAIVELKAASESQFRLVIHMNSSAMPDVGEGLDTRYPGGLVSGGGDLYIVSGFSTFQKLASDFYLRTVHGVYVDTVLYTVPFGTPPFRYTYAWLVQPDALVFVLSLVFFTNTVIHTIRVAEEKHAGMRMTMITMGVPNSVLHVSEFTVQCSKLLLSCALCVLFLRATLIAGTSPLILFLLFLLFSLTTIPLSGLVATFCRDTRLAALCAGLLYFLFAIPILALPNATSTTAIGLSLLSPSAFATAVDVLFRHEIAGGFRSGDFSSQQDSPTMGVLLGMLGVDAVVYYLLYLYCEAVVPQPFGTPKHPLFFIIDPIKACIRLTSKQPAVQTITEESTEDEFMEAVDHADDTVQFHGLRKELRRGGQRFMAVDGFSWGMREGEISALLGHNGAGKSTVLRMLTGVIQPDDGDCTVYGSSVRTQTDDVRQNLGSCPQHNSLWPELTCREHLEFFGMIKGLKGVGLEAAVYRMLYETDLLDKENEQAGSLSGGQKRKLSVSIAFVGNSRLVVLDEPTAHLDIGARRRVWNLLKSMSKGRTILLTTHYMDEADLLGDQIGIMGQGRLLCSGSSSFLKAKYGIGYNLAVFIEPEASRATLDELVCRSVPDVEVLGHRGFEVQYRLPAANAGQFPPLLKVFDRDYKAYGVRGYALSGTTLEEVFIKANGTDAGPSRVLTISAADSGVVWKCEFCKHKRWEQFTTVLRKRLLCAIRDPQVVLFQLCVPLVCVLIALLLNLVNDKKATTLELNYGVFTGDRRPVVETSQCFELWGEHQSVMGATVNETHYANALQLDYFALDTWFSHHLPRYGAIACNDRDLQHALQEAGAAANLSATVLLYNTSVKHQSGLNIATYYELLARSLTGSEVSMQYGVELFTPPKSFNYLRLVLLFALIVVGVVFCQSTVTAWMVQERESSSLQLQRLSGLDFLSFWGGNFVFDVCSYVLVAALCVALFAAFNFTMLMGPSRVGPTVVLLLLYGLTSTVEAYGLSFFFSTPAVAQVGTVLFAFFTGAVLVLLCDLLTNQGPDIAGRVVGRVRFVFRLFPMFCFGESLMTQLVFDFRSSLDSSASLWQMTQLGWPLVYLALEFPVLFLIVLISDHPGVKRWKESRLYKRYAVVEEVVDVASDVENERRAVYESAAHPDPSEALRVVDLQKTYANGNHAVRGLTFTVFGGEVFGFLGTNGAGKTTTVSMLCQQCVPSSGTAFICGHDVVSDSKQALGCVGYCPQADATFDLLTVEEHLNLYASIRGIAKAARRKVVDVLIEMCQLDLYKDAKVVELSGGNRRRLSVALALVGGPKVVFLDEPSAAMDAVSRRAMWETVRLAAKHCSVVLTTHRLDEVEALAESIAIMVDGRLHCLGDKAYIKHKYGSGCEVSLRTMPNSNATDVVASMQRQFRGVKLKDCSGDRIVFQFPRRFSLAEVFETLAAQQAWLGISEYSVSQTSVEQVFLSVSDEAQR